ncbi:unnamed protein product [Protopolystoma xenopodis]|uniref:Sister chromatid cohesion protein DCC1 n=1 Tax=Protopolystoma xenopodis TaxID=117903 RepID=A0A3S5B0X1_9PLAT|nr:unnamed protein product [Protopolystoma xenopodis]
MDSRTLDQVDHLLRLSRLDPEDFLDIKQVIYFDQNANEVNDNFIVFELPKQMVEAMLLSSQEPLLVLKSENEGAVFACTGTETCSLVEVESSNTVLYTSSLWLPQAKPENAPAETISSSSLFFNPVEFSQNKIIELVPFNGPRLHPLKKLLSPSSFMGHIEDEAEDTDGINLISLNQLRKLTPCSESELQIALKRLNCCHWNGYVRLMEVGYLQNFMRDVFNVIDEHSWDWRKNGVLLDSAIKALDALYPPQLMPHLFRLFCSKYRPRRRFKITGRDTLTPKRLLVTPKHSLDNEEQLSKVLIYIWLVDFIFYLL